MRAAGDAGAPGADDRGSDDPPSSAGWVRFDRYELRDGVIRSAAGARSEPYDPWAAYRTARSGWGGRGGRAPYESLLALAWSIRLRPGPPGEGARLERASERAVLAWCTQHGLLGLLPHEVELVHLAPRWALDPARGGPVAELRGYGHAYGGWESIREVHRPAEVPASARAGDLVPRRLWPPLWDAPTVHGHRLGDGAWARRPLDAAWGPYFPDVPADVRDTHAYPPPLSAAFWAAYGEPIGHFLSAAILFADTLRALGAPPTPGRIADRESDRERAARAFAGLSVGVQPVLLGGPNGREGGWRAKSLLGSLALMAYLDIGAGWRVIDCGECGAPVATGAYQGRYCSARCRNTALKRTYRRRRRDRGAAASAREPGLARGDGHSDTSPSTIERGVVTDTSSIT